MSPTPDLPTATKPIFVPVALKLDEAQALHNAALATFNALSFRGLAALHGGELARGMVTLARAIDAATGAET